MYSCNVGQKHTHTAVLKIHLTDISALYLTYQISFEQKQQICSPNSSMPTWLNNFFKDFGGGGDKVFVICLQQLMQNKAAKQDNGSWPSTPHQPRPS